MITVLFFSPKLAPIQVAIVPIYRKAEELVAITEKVDVIVRKLKERGVSVKFDDRDSQKPGWKFAEYEMKGVPVRLAIGKRDLENGTIEVARRDTLTKETYPIDNVDQLVVDLLDEIQENIYNRALDFRSKNITTVDSYDEFKELIDSKGGFFLAHWDGTVETENKIKEETKSYNPMYPI